jgi:hypothetical protein
MALMSLWRPLFGGGALLALAGCGVGVDRTLFFTTTNIGINLDRAPPLAEISVARREGVIQPAFEGGRHLPVAASMRMETGFLGSIAPTAIGQVFAGGAAAQILTATDDLPATTPLAMRQATLCLSREPRVDGRVAFPANTDVRHFVFGTDTSIGLVVGWADPASPLPDSVRLGYRRNELALAPVLGRALANGETCTETLADPATNTQVTISGSYIVGMPSFMATIQSGASAGAAQQGGFNVGQTFATGTAARQLAARGEIRDAFLAGVGRDVRAASQVGAYTGDATAICINRWLGTERGQRDQRLNEIQAWLRGKSIAQTAPLWANDDSPAALGQRQEFLTEKRGAIRCD